MTVKKYSKELKTRRRFKGPNKPEPRAGRGSSACGGGRRGPGAGRRGSARGGGRRGPGAGRRAPRAGVGGAGPVAETLGTGSLTASEEEDSAQTMTPVRFFLFILGTICRGGS